MLACTTGGGSGSPSLLPTHSLLPLLLLLQEGQSGLFPQRRLLCLLQGGRQWAQQQQHQCCSQWVTAGAQGGAHATPLAAKGAACTVLSHPVGMARTLLLAARLVSCQ